MVRKFKPTTLFFAGDTVWDETHKCVATVLNNYGNSLEGDRGEIRVDMDGNVPIFKYDDKSNRIGYNLLRLIGKHEIERYKLLEIAYLFSSLSTPDANLLAENARKEFLRVAPEFNAYLKKAKKVIEEIRGVF